MGSIIQLSGEDGTALEFNLRGGVGCISVTANVAAKLCSEFQEASLSKIIATSSSKAKEINEKLMLIKLYLLRATLVLVKYARFIKPIIRRRKVANG